MLLCVVGDDAPGDGVALYVSYVRVYLESRKNNCNILFLFLLFPQHRAEIQRSSKRRAQCLKEISPKPCWRRTPVVLLLLADKRPTGFPYAGKETFLWANQRAGICARLVSESIELSLRTVIGVDNGGSRQALNYLCSFVCLCYLYKATGNRSGEHEDNYITEVLCDVQRHSSRLSIISDWSFDLRV